MATTNTSGFVLQSAAPAVLPNHPPTSRQRRITPQAGRALEILGHAIEYLADEYVYHGGQLSGSDGQVQAMRLLMELNRNIYLECEVVPSFSERCSGFTRTLGIALSYKRKKI